LEQLLIGFIQVGVLAFVLPSEKAFFPDIGIAVAALLLINTCFKDKSLAGGVCFSGGVVAYQVTQVDEMLLGRRAFFERYTKRTLKFPSYLLIE